MSPLKANHIDNRVAETTAVKPGILGRGGREPLLVVAAMFAYQLLAGTALSSTRAPVAAAASGVAYLLSVYLYYGIARLAYSGHNYLLWGGAVLAFVAGYFVSGMVGLWPLLTTWSLVLFASVIVGRLSAAGRNQYRVYLISLLIAVGFSLAYFLPQISLQIEAMTVSSQAFIDWMRQGLIAAKYGEDAVNQNLESVQIMFKAMIRLLPSILVLSAIVPFSVGFLIFNLRLDKKSYPGRTVMPFALWKVPFGVMPVLVVSILLRILGSGTVTVVADNILAFLAFYYLVTGLALVEYNLRKFLPTYLRVTFYVAFFVFQFAGLYVALAMLFMIAFLGFVDSFADWRKVQQLSLVKE